MSTVPRLPVGLASWERAMNAAEAVRQRMLRATAALEQAGVPYAVIGGNAVASWVGSVDAGAVRTTKDVDLLLRRDDLDRAKATLTAAGFVYAETWDVHMFLDGPQARPSESVHLIFAGEKVKVDDLAAAPDVTDVVTLDALRVVNLEAIVRMKLTSYRDKDRTHIRDMIGVGLIDATWPARFPAELAARLQQILDTPGG
jgi:hypothetical protein